MRHEPSGFVRKANHAVKLVHTDAFLAGAHQVRRQKPFRHRNVRSFVNRANSGSEFASAIFAVIPARPHRFATKRLDGFKLAAERTISPVRPADRFEMRTGGIRVCENRVGQVNGSGYG